jgi:hypothetical protein
MLAPGEHVLTTGDVSAMGGQSAVYGFRQGLHLAKGGAVPGKKSAPLSARPLGPDAPLPSLGDLAGMIPASLSERVAAVTQGLAGFVEVLKQAWQQFSDAAGVVRDRTKDLTGAQHDHRVALEKLAKEQTKAGSGSAAVEARIAKREASRKLAADKQDASDQRSLASAESAAAKKSAQERIADHATARKAQAVEDAKLAAQERKASGVKNSERIKELEQAVKATSLASSVSGTVQGFDGGLTGHQDTRNNFANLFKGQLYDLAQQTKFVGQLAALKKLGLNSAALADLAGKGVEGGGVTAAALLGGGKAGIANVNLLQGKMKAIADKGGALVGDAMYANGIKAAEGFIKGLESHQAAIGVVMGKVAAGIDGKFKKALKIHSPSQVFASHGENIVKGLAQGVTGGQAAIDKAMAKMHVAVPGSHLISHGGGSASPVIQLNIRSSDPLAQAVASMIQVRIEDNNADLGRSFAKVGAQQ